MKAKRKNPPKAQKKIRLLAGGNPQISMAHGNDAVQSYIAAMPGWKRAAGKKIDRALSHSVPTARKAVKWNSPFYGTPGQGWFASFHCLAKYIKIAFLNGTALDPQPPVKSKVKNVRYFHVTEDDPIDEKLLEKWFRQAAVLPGWKTGDLES